MTESSEKSKQGQKTNEKDPEQPQFLIEFEIEIPRSKLDDKETYNLNQIVLKIKPAKEGELSKLEIDKDKAVGSSISEQSSHYPNLAKYIKDTTDSDEKLVSALNNRTVLEPSVDKSQAENSSVLYVSNQNYQEQHDRSQSEEVEEVEEDQRDVEKEASNSILKATNDFDQEVVKSLNYESLTYKQKNLSSTLEDIHKTIRDPDESNVTQKRKEELDADSSDINSHLTSLWHVSPMISDGDDLDNTVTNNEIDDEPIDQNYQSRLNYDYSNNYNPFLTLDPSLNDKDIDINKSLTYEQYHELDHFIFVAKNRNISLSNETSSILIDENLLDPNQTNQYLDANDTIIGKFKKIKKVKN